MPAILDTERCHDMVEVCQTHHMYRMEGSEWKRAGKRVSVYDISDDADFVESTCPHCSSDDQPDLFDLFSGGGDLYERA